MFDRRLIHSIWIVALIVFGFLCFGAVLELMAYPSAFIGFLSGPLSIFLGALGIGSLTYAITELQNPKRSRYESSTEPEPDMGLTKGQDSARRAQASPSLEVQTSENSATEEHMPVKHVHLQHLQDLKREHWTDSWNEVQKQRQIADWIDFAMLLIAFAVVGAVVWTDAVDFSPMWLFVILFVKFVVDKSVRIRAQKRIVRVTKLDPDLVHKLWRKSPNTSAWAITWLVGLFVLGGMLSKNLMRDYHVRSRLSEATVLAHDAMTAVDATFRRTGTLGSISGNTWPLGVAPRASYRDTYVESVTIAEKGVITVRFTDDPRLAGARNGTATFAPAVKGDHLVWTEQCSFAEKWCSGLRKVVTGPKN
jgi:hypothetical protein